MSVRTALVGCGRWGTKLLAAVLRHRGFEVVAIADCDEAARDRARAMAPGARICASLEDALETSPAAVLVATPSGLHAEHGLRALAAGADVFVEKPLALSSDDARELCAATRTFERIGMVGHVLRYHPAVERLIALAREGYVGRPRVVTGTRFTQSGSASPLWTLGPHDLCTLHAVDGSPVTHMLACPLPAVPGGAADGTEGVEPRGVVLQVGLESGLIAVLRLSTTAPTPARELRVHGRQGVIGVDELAGPGRLQSSIEPLSTSGIGAGPRSMAPLSTRGEGLRPSMAPLLTRGEGLRPSRPPQSTRGEGLRPSMAPLSMRGEGLRPSSPPVSARGEGLRSSMAPPLSSAVEVPRGWSLEASPLHHSIDVDPAEPLERELSHFVECVERRAEARTSFERALWVVEVLERAEGMLVDDEARSVPSPFTPRAAAP